MCGLVAFISIPLVCPRNSMSLSDGWAMKGTNEGSKLFVLERGG